MLLGFAPAGLLPEKASGRAYNRWLRRGLVLAGRQLPGGVFPRGPRVQHHALGKTAKARGKERGTGLRARFVRIVVRILSWWVGGKVELQCVCSSPLVGIYSAWT